MSTYTPIATQKLIEDLSSLAMEPDDVFNERLNGENFEHGTSEHLSAIDVAMDFGLSTALIVPLHEHLRALATAQQSLNNCFWASVYGPELVNKICLTLFGPDLRLAILRARTQRSVLLTGAEGSGREAIGCSIINVAAEKLRVLGTAKSKTAVASSAKSFGNDDQVQTLFGAPSLGNGRHGFLSGLDQGWAFLDRVDALEENAKKHLAAYLSGERLPSHVMRGTRRRLHCLFGCDALPVDEAVGPELSNLVTEDGHIDLPTMDSLLGSDRFWAIAFPQLFERVARILCGAAHSHLHRIHEGQLNHENFVADNALEATERRDYLDWMTEDSRVRKLGQILRHELAERVWTGQLRGFESLLRRIILDDAHGEFHPMRISQLCSTVLGKTPKITPSTPKAPAWRAGLSTPLKPLPLTAEKLPEVMAAVECQYFREAAREAATACAPKAAKMQDIARILGIPRQTAARKWQMHGLPSALLAGVVEDGQAARN